MTNVESSEPSSLFGSGQEKGAAMIEAAILIPFLLFTTLSCWDAGRILSAHAVITRNADELAQMFATDPQLSFGSYEMSYIGGAMPKATESNFSSYCQSAEGYVCSECQNEVCERGCGESPSARKNLCDAVTQAESTGMSEIREGSSIARVNFIAPINSTQDYQIEAKISVTFEGIFLFHNQKFTVTKTLPYLGPR